MRASRGIWSTCAKFIGAVAVIVTVKTVLQGYFMQSDRVLKEKHSDSRALPSSILGRSSDVLVGIGQKKEKATGDYSLSKDIINNVARNIHHLSQNSEVEDMRLAIAHLHQATNSTCASLNRPATVQYAPTGNYWQMNKKDKDEIHIFSAFYDDRPPVGLLPYIRLMTVSTLVKDAPAYCQIWYEGLERPYVTPVIAHSSGRGEKLFGVRYGQWLYSCQLPSALPVPTHVSVAFELCQQTSMYVPIYIPVRAPWVHEFGVCVAIAFGEVNRIQLIEWIEINRLFGVTEINVYNASMSKEINNVLEYYQNDGILRLHQMPPPVPDYSKKGSKLGSPASLNDCMLRNAYRYRFMVVIDFDEVIVPKNLINYTQTITDIDTSAKLTQSAMSYSFRNEFFFSEYEEDKTQPEYLRLMRYREHAKAGRFLFAPKSFIDPRQCLSVFNHYCYNRFPGAPNKFTVDVPVSIATSHHYKSCHYGKDSCQEYAESKIKEDYILPLSPVLKPLVLTVMTELNLAQNYTK